MTFLTLLPLAVVMVAGTQLVAAVFFASSDRPRAASLGYLAGAALVVLGGTTLAWLAVHLFKINFTGAGRGTVERWIDWFVLALLAVLAVVVFLRRHAGRLGGWVSSSTLAPGTRRRWVCCCSWGCPPTT